MPVETIHVQSLIERDPRLEHVILLRSSQKGVKVCAEPVITDMVEIALRPCHTLYVKAT